MRFEWIKVEAKDGGSAWLVTWGYTDEERFNATAFGDADRCIAWLTSRFAWSPSVAELDGFYAENEA